MLVFGSTVTYYVDLVAYDVAEYVKYEDAESITGVIGTIENILQGGLSTNKEVCAVNLDRAKKAAAQIIELESLLDSKIANAKHVKGGMKNAESKECEAQGI